MKQYIVGIVGLLLTATTSCTSLSEGEGTMPVDPQHNRRVVYSEGGISQSVRRQMYEQASHVNRKRNIEAPSQNAPATTPPVLRPRQVPHAPVDSTRHNVQVPLRHVVPVN